MKLEDILLNTAEEYAARRVATVRKSKPDDESNLHWRGMVNDRDGNPARHVGLVIVKTSEPQAFVEIRDDEALEPANFVAFESLDELNAIVNYSEGRGGILWVNAGMIGIMSGAAIANAHRVYEISKRQEEDGLSWSESSRRLSWQSFKLVKLLKGRRGAIVLDWVGETVARIAEDSELPTPDTGSGSPAQEPLKSPAEGRPGSEEPSASESQEATGSP